MTRPYFGKLAYRVLWTRDDGTSGNATFGENRSLAMEHARRMAAADFTTGPVSVESLDDQYPANVISTTTIEG